MDMDRVMKIIVYPFGAFLFYRGLQLLGVYTPPVVYPIILSLFTLLEKEYGIIYYLLSWLLIFAADRAFFPINNEIIYFIWPPFIYLAPISGYFDKSGVGEQGKIESFVLLIPLYALITLLWLLKYIYALPNLLIIPLLNIPNNILELNIILLISFPIYSEFAYYLTGVMTKWIEE